MAEEQVPVKPGYKSTEFWISLLVAMVSFIYASGVLEQTETMWDNRIVGLIAGVLASMGYVVSRTLVKRWGS